MPNYPLSPTPPLAFTPSYPPVGQHYGKAVPVKPEDGSPSSTSTNRIQYGGQHPNAALTSGRVQEPPYQRPLSAHQVPLSATLGTHNWQPGHFPSFEDLLGSIPHNQQFLPAQPNFGPAINIPHLRPLQTPSAQVHSQQLSRSESWQSQIHPPPVVPSSSQTHPSQEIPSVSLPRLYPYPTPTALMDHPRNGGASGSGVHGISQAPVNDDSHPTSMTTTTFPKLINSFASKCAQESLIPNVLLAPRAFSSMNGFYRNKVKKNIASGARITVRECLGNGSPGLGNVPIGKIKKLLKETQPSMMQNNVTIQSLIQTFTKVKLLREVEGRTQAECEDGVMKMIQVSTAIIPDLLGWDDRWELSVSMPRMVSTSDTGFMAEVTLKDKWGWHKQQQHRRTILGIEVKAIDFSVRRSESDSHGNRSAVPLDSFISLVEKNGIHTFPTFRSTLNQHEPGQSMSNVRGLTRQQSQARTTIIFPFYIWSTMSQVNAPPLSIFSTYYGALFHFFAIDEGEGSAQRGIGVSENYGSGWDAVDDGVRTSKETYLEMQYCYLWLVLAGLFLTDESLFPSNFSLLPELRTFRDRNPFRS